MDSIEYLEVPKIAKDQALAVALRDSCTSRLSSEVINDGPWILKSADTFNLLRKLSEQGTPFSSCARRIFQGLKTSADKVYVLDLLELRSDSLLAHSAQLDADVEIERGLARTLIKGTEMRPFAPLPAKRVVLFPYVAEGGTARLLTEKELRSETPRTYAYLKSNEKVLRARERGKMNHANWYAYGRNQALDVMALPKLITPDLAPRSSFLIDEAGELFFLGGAAGGYGILLEESLNALYVLGLLNSNTLSFFISAAGQRMESGYFSFEARFIRAAPIRRIDPSDTAGRKLHDQIVELADRSVTLRRRFAEQTPGHDRTVLEREIAATHRQIDALVYRLYGLTDSEIAIVEQAATK